MTSPLSAPTRHQGVVFGAGSVGRGFIGQLLGEAGWGVTFVDTDQRLVQHLTQDGGYTHVTISSEGSLRSWVSPVTAIDARDSSAVTGAVVAADLVVTCVGANILPAVIKAMAPGIARRIALGGEPINVLLAENLHHAAKVARDLLEKQLPGIDPEVLDAQVGLMEASIGRMIPVPDVETRAVDPTIILAEPYRLLPYDDAARRGPRLDIPGLVSDPRVPFAFYVDRKLHVHNMGHFLCGLLAEAAGADRISDAIGHSTIRDITRSAMVESCMALSSTYAQPLAPLMEHVDELLRRFDNPALGDTVERVIRDLPRKMAPEDRMVGAFASALREGTPSAFLSLGVAVGTHRLATEADWSEDECFAFVEKLLAETGVDLTLDHRAFLEAQLQALRDHGLDLAEQLALANGVLNHF
jgi:mannitol-1-phosphate 5-dehydrogenase